MIKIIDNAVGSAYSIFMEQYNHIDRAQIIDFDYVLERALVFKKDTAELHTMIGSLALFINGESEDSLSSLGWVDEDDFIIIEKDPRVIAAQQALENARHTASMERARELSRCNEWRALFEHFLIPLSKQDAA